MTMLRRFALLVALCSFGCTGADGEPGVTDTCHDSTGKAYGPCRVFTGRLQLPLPRDLVLPAKGLQLAAVGFEPAAPSAGAATDGGPATDGGTTATDGTTPGKPTDRATPRLFFGPVVAQEAGGGQQATIPLSLVVPCALSLNLLLQVPGSSEGSVPGLLVAAVSFPSGSDGNAATLVPRQPDDLCGSKTNNLDLGRVVLELQAKGALSSGTIILGKGNARNPLSLVDTDGDGTDDLQDTDDDDDGTIDPADDDAEGDGIQDAAESLGALPDQNEDGVPDLFQ
jgi:hypothetical protein